MVGGVGLDVNSHLGYTQYVCRDLQRGHSDT